MPDAGIDVSLKDSSICVVSAGGKIAREAKVASEPEALVRCFAELKLTVTRIGLETGPLSQWLRAGLTAAGRRAQTGRRPLPTRRRASAAGVAVR